MIAAIGRGMRDYPCRWMLALALPFMIVPRLDIAVSGWFYRPGEGFFLRYAPFLEFVRDASPPLTIGAAVFVLLLGIASAVFDDTFLGIDKRRATYLVSSLIVGPGLLANSLFKEHWGRARPSTIVEFGGAKTFTPPLTISDQCASNCSFVSGHAAMAFWVIAFAFLAPPRYRTAAFAAALGYGMLVGLVRVAQGGHYLSDVLYAGALTTAVAWYLYRKLITPRC